LNLDDDQMRAATHAGPRPAIVIAGPGSGKTRTLIGRHLHLHRTGVPRESILTATFTVKAAQEVRARLVEAHGDISETELGRMFVGTFHGLCVRLLRQFHDRVGLPKDFQIVGDEAQIALLKETGLTWHGEYSDLVDMISRWKDRLVSPVEASAEAARRQTPDLVQAAEIYGAYERELAERGVCDFPRLIIATVRAAKADEAVRSFLQRRFRHVLVDEFQDTNRLQIALLEALVGQGGNLWVVGDDDQALYGWRGADVRYATDFGRRFRGGARYVLSRNYRSTPAVVAAANAVITVNTVRVDKTTVPMVEAEEGDGVHIAGFGDDREEAAAVAKAVARRLRGGVRPRDVAVLFRSGSLAPVVQAALAREKIPVRLSGIGSFWSLPEVRLFVAVLRAASGSASAEDREALEKHPRRRQISAFLHTMKGAPIAAAAEPASNLVANLVPEGLAPDRTGLWIEAAQQAAIEAAECGSYARFFEHVGISSGTSTAGDDEEAVVLSTIHAAKGLEWPTVFVVGAELAMLPHHKSTDVEEERRLLYVAVTRAMRQCFVSYADERFARAQFASPFLFEMADRCGSAHPIGWRNRPVRPTPLPAEGV
jgi:DNA helicase II / ATP-dependent DNA helicase PcrA